MKKNYEENYDDEEKFLFRFLFWANISLSCIMIIFGILLMLKAVNFF